MATDKRRQCVDSGRPPLRRYTELIAVWGPDPAGGSRIVRWIRADRD
jgi:hypothetical protein